MTSVELGETYADKVTGYVGVATARNEIYCGTTNVKIERLDKSGNIEELWLPEERLQEHDGSQRGVGF